jgi:membrane fusion protein (multidrug efflux system)
MPESRQPPAEPEADPAPDENDPSAPPPDLWRHGTPHAEKPGESHRIHPEGLSDRDDGDDHGDHPSKSRNGRDPQRQPSNPKQQRDSEHKTTDDAKQAGDKKSPAHAGQSKDEPKEADRRPLYQKPIVWIAIALILVGAIVGILYWLHARDYESTDDAFIESHTTQISPQVSARVMKVYVDDNQRVKAGDKLVDLDPTDYEVALAQAKGSETASAGKLEQAKAQVASSRASLDEANASLDAANVAFANADRDLKRFEALDERARSQQQYDNALTAQKNAAAQVAQAKAKVASAESQINVAIANVAAAEGDFQTSVANRKRAEVNLGYTHVVAPEDGRVTTKNVEPGQYATMGTPLMAIVQEDVWVVANFKETQLTDMRVGQPVTVEVDAFPDLKLNAKIASIQAGTGARFSVLPAENATGNFVKVVQRVPVKIVFDQKQNQDPNVLLAPGMSVMPYVKVR